jgi:hypothetical protein
MHFLIFPEHLECLAKAWMEAPEMQAFIDWLAEMLRVEAEMGGDKVRTLVVGHILKFIGECTIEASGMQLTEEVSRTSGKPSDN